MNEQQISDLFKDVFVSRKGSYYEQKYGSFGPGNYDVLFLLNSRKIKNSNKSLDNGCKLQPTFYVSPKGGAFGLTLAKVPELTAEQKRLLPQMKEYQQLESLRDFEGQIVLSLHGSMTQLSQKKFFIFSADVPALLVQAIYNAAFFIDLDGLKSVIEKFKTDLENISKLPVVFVYEEEA